MNKPDIPETRIMLKHGIGYIKTITFLSIILIIQLILLFFAFNNANAKRPEKFYQDMYCEGVTEYVLPDKTRVDCLTETTAGEFDFGYKVYDAIGQSLYYAMKTGKKPKIYLIIDSTEYRYLSRLKEVNEFYKLGIEIEVIEKEDE